jgi:hypothetical protein
MGTDEDINVDWPEFEYTNSSFLNGCRRSVTPKSPHAGAQYLLIDDRPLHEPMSGLVELELPADRTTMLLRLVAAGKRGFIYRKASAAVA